ncbi:hypothetical protein EBR04_10740, partial [bacterium]|nr:hypothetical protein [bacterium]
EAIERLAAFGVPVDQVTYLDPHDFRQDAGGKAGQTSQTDKGIGSVPPPPLSPIVPSLDGAPWQWTLGYPHGPADATDGRSSYGATVWNNVKFADVYYQTTTEASYRYPVTVNGVTQMVTLAIDDLIPEGRPIPGAYNRLLEPNDPRMAGFNDHSEVWENFYISTIRDPSSSPDGFALTRLANTRAGLSAAANATNTARARDAAPKNFLSSDQDHTWSSLDLVQRIELSSEVSWLPDLVGMASLGLSAEQVTRGGWVPEWSPLTIANGGFSDAGTGGYFPGWSNHGGGGDGVVVDPAGFDEQGNVLELSLLKSDRTHNRMYVPREATEVAFSVRRVQKSLNDRLVVKIGDRRLRDPQGNDFYALDVQDAGFAPVRFIIPEDLRGQVNSLSFSVERTGQGFTVVDAKVQID